MLSFAVCFYVFSMCKDKVKLSKSIILFCFFLRFSCLKTSYETKNALRLIILTAKRPFIVN